MSLLRFGQPIRILHRGAMLVTVSIAADGEEPRNSQELLMVRALERAGR